MNPAERVLWLNTEISRLTDKIEALMDLPDSDMHNKEIDELDFQVSSYETEKNLILRNNKPCPVYDLTKYREQKRLIHTKKGA